MKEKEFEMCGIIGVISHLGCSEYLALESLKHLEYRGYDSFGLVSTRDFVAKKQVGPVSKANLVLDKESRLTIAHTRWATHGKVSIENTHPHSSHQSRFHIVHNGVISNFESLKHFLMSKGFKFYGQTDSEVVVNLLEYLELNEFNPLEESREQLLSKLVKRLEGEYAIAILGRDWGDSIYAIKNKSPLVFALKDNLAFIASDELPLVEHFEQFYELDDLQILALKREGTIQAHVCSSQEPLNSLHITPQKITKSIEGMELGDAPNFMWKEMQDIPKALEEACKLDVSFVRESLRDSRVVLTGCGSAFYAAQIGHIFRKIAQPTSQTLSFAADEIASIYTFSEFDVALGISQSGETYDTLEPLRELKLKNQKVACITNVSNSSLYKLSDYPLFQNAGVERCVLSTKSILSQCAILYRLFGDETLEGKNLEILALTWQHIFKKERLNKIESIAHQVVELGIDNLFFIGRGLLNPIAFENALKVKEVTYIHAEGMGAGFFKHGTLSLIDERFITFAHLPNKDCFPDLYDLTQANIQEIQARGGYVITIGSNADCDITFPCIEGAIDALIHLGVGQYLAYFIALRLGRNVDQPRSLAKSVTVR